VPFTEVLTLWGHWVQQVAELPERSPFAVRVTDD
jgi:hypothetical protein